MHILVKCWLPVVLWAAFIFYLSSISDLRSAFPDTWDFVFRKIAHVTEYAILAALVLRALKAHKVKRAFLLTLIIIIVYAISDEFHQSFVPGRVGSWEDVVIDVMGGFIAIFTISKWFESKKSRT